MTDLRQCLAHDECRSVLEMGRACFEAGPCREDTHDPDETQTCKRCGQSVCYGCGRAFDLACDLCD